MEKYSIEEPVYVVNRETNMVHHTCISSIQKITIIDRRGTSYSHKYEIPINDKMLWVDDCNVFRNENDANLYLSTIQHKIDREVCPRCHLYDKGSDEICPQCRINYLEQSLQTAKGTLLLLNDFLWYDTVSVGYKEMIVKKLKENGCRVDQGWEEF